MADDRTQEATPYRRQKAREKGQVARSKELPGALALIAIILMMHGSWADFVEQWKSLLRDELFMMSGRHPASVFFATERTVRVVGTWALPVLMAGFFLSVLGNLGQGGFVFSTAGLTPSVGRLSPAHNLGKIFSISGLGNFLKSIVPMVVIGYLAFTMISGDWGRIVFAGLEPARRSITWLMQCIYKLSWQAGAIFLAWSAFDYLFQRTQLSRNLRMSRQEVIQEAKDTIGNPQIKARIRKIQRQMRRRRMRHEVAKSTVVVTNPTEYAVALRYEPQVMRAPVVMAKGRNLIAQQIRQEAVWQKIPIVENPPLARALYSAVEVGQTIPPSLYVAVAEILAFIFRTQARAAAAARRARAS